MKNVQNISSFFVHFILLFLLVDFSFPIILILTLSLAMAHVLSSENLEVWLK